MYQILVSKYDLFNIKLQFAKSDAYDIRRNLNIWFSQFAPNYKFDWRFKNKRWDGKIRFFDNKKSTLPIGLLDELKEFAKTFQYSLEIESNVNINNFENETSEDILDFINTFVEKLNLKFTPRKYQLQYFTKFVQKNVELLISPTSSGKSLIIYMCMRYVLSLLPQDQKILIIVPTIQLVEQMYGDFKDYGFNSDKYCAQIYSGSKDHDVKLKTDKRIIISTWQSLYKLQNDEFLNIGFLVGDEIHRFGAKQAKSVITNCKNATFRLGTTGTLQNDDKCSLWTIQGMFDTPVKYVSTKKLINDGHISDIQIEVLNLQYPEDKCKICKTLTYFEEIDYISIQEERINLIVDIVRKILDKKENVLLLFSKIEYGKKIKAAIEKNIYNNSYNVSYVDGSVNMRYREKLRELMESNNSFPAICSFGTFSTGINIKNLHNVIFLNSGKAEIKLLQSIGRALRLHKSKKKAKIWDLVDNLQYKKKMNYSLNHFIQRKKIYSREGFSIKYHNINIK